MTGLALAYCILGKFLGVVCHCFPPRVDEYNKLIIKQEFVHCTFTKIPKVVYSIITHQYIVNNT